MTLSAITEHLFLLMGGGVPPYLFYFHIYFISGPLNILSVLLTSSAPIRLIKRPMMPRIIKLVNHRDQESSQIMK